MLKLFASYHRFLFTFTIVFTYLILCTYLIFIRSAKVYSPIMWKALKQLSTEESILHTPSCTAEQDFECFSFSDG